MNWSFKQAARAPPTRPLCPVRFVTSFYVLLLCSVLLQIESLWLETQAGKTRASASFWGPNWIDTAKALTGCKMHRGVLFLTVPKSVPKIYGWGWDIGFGFFPPTWQVFLCDGCWWRQWGLGPRRCSTLPWLGNRIQMRLNWQLEVSERDRMSG